MSGSLCSRGNWCLQYIVTQQNSYPGNRTHGIRLMQQMFTECLLHARLCSGYFISMRKQTKISSLLEFILKTSSMVLHLCFVISASHRSRRMRWAFINSAFVPAVLLCLPGLVALWQVPLTQEGGRLDCFSRDVQQRGPGVTDSLP